MKLLRILVAPALVLCAALAFAADIDPPDVVGRLNYISGPVSFAPAQANEDWSAATLNRPITTGDRLWTDTNGRAELHVGSLAIRMDAQTSADVLNLDDRTLQLRLAQGSANLRVRRLASDQLLEIATPSGAVVVRQPGSYRIHVDSSGAATTVAVRAGGQAEVFTGNSSFVVDDDQQAVLAGSRQALFAAPSPDEFDRWAAGRDQHEDHVISTRYVTEEMTGYEDLDRYGAWSTVPDYGPVWVPTAVPAGWAPYRTGHWVWISPWGWTWVDSAPWGFAPFHYGRWVWLGNHWAWAPGRRVARPVYAPALVAFVGGSNWSLSVGAGPAVGWVPLGWREPYRPWYRASHAHVRNVNVTHVTNVTNITNNVTNVRLVNRNAPSAVTVVSRENFVAARRADRAALRVDARTLAAAPVTQGAPVATPARTSLAAAERGAQPPAAARTRETVAVNTPPAPAPIREAREDARNARLAGNDERPRVRVINRGERVNLQQAADSQRPGAPAPQAQSPAETPPQSTLQPAQAVRSERAQDKAGPQSQPQPNQQAERRAPAPPPEVSRRPTFDRDMRPSTAEARREQRQAERQERQADRQEQREQPFVQRNDLPRPQAAQPDTRTTTTPRPARDALRAQQLEQQQQQEQAQQQQAREQQARQREMQRQQEEQQRVQQQRAQQQAQEQQAREQQGRQREAQRQQEERQRAQQQLAQQQEQQRRQLAQEQQALGQQARQREMQSQQEQQRVQRQRAPQQAQEQQAREQHARQREIQQQQAQQQRVQPQRAQQPEQPRPQQARDQQAQHQRAMQQQREQRPQQQQHTEQGREKGRDRQRAARSEKG